MMILMISNLLHLIANSLQEEMVRVVFFLTKEPNKPVWMFPSSCIVHYVNYFSYMYCIVEGDVIEQTVRVAS